VKNRFAIADILPFFRYAVCPTAGFCPGLPFYRLRSARAFFDEARRDCPLTGVVLLKRGWSGVTVIDAHLPWEQ
jgi:hypothetical protein